MTLVEDEMAHACNVMMLKGSFRPPVFLCVRRISELRSGPALLIKFVCWQNTHATQDYLRIRPCICVRTGGAKFDRVVSFSGAAAAICKAVAFAKFVHSREILRIFPDEASVFPLSGTRRA